MNPSDAVCILTSRGGINMVKLLGVLLLGVGTVAWLAWRVKRCSSCGCGVVELDHKPSSGA